MRPSILKPVLICLLFVATTLTPAVGRQPDSLSLDNGISMQLLEADGQFLGIGEIRLGDTILHTAEHPVLPLMAADWRFPDGLYSDLRLVDVRAESGGYGLVMELRESPGAEAWKRFFVIDEEGQIDRDEFFFARTALYTGMETGRPHFPPHEPAARPAGQLIWRIEPVTEIIAGWEWQGWRWSFRGFLENDEELNAFRLLSTWALNGSMDGLTLVNQRYRGLGYPAQTFSDTGSGVSTCWNTQDLQLPAKWSGHSAGMSREEALEIRNTCTIHAPARGAGTSFIDYQYRPDAALVGFPEKQGNLRALTEIYPGDRLPGQVDEEHFEASSEWETIPQRYLVFTTENPYPANFWRTRYLELDQRIRAAVAAELGFKETPVVPTVGSLFDFWKSWDGFAQVVARLGAHAGRWSELGVRRIMVHNPGWENGRAARNGWDGADRESFVGGSVNTVYDWWPLPEVESAWRHTHDALQELGIDYYVWISGMTHRDAGFHERVGEDPAAWASNHPDGSPSPIYGSNTLKHNILSPDFREAYDERLAAVRHEFGYEGFWGDSFQNLFMSQLDWRNHKGKPQQRAWWEWLSQRSREGVGWISESQSFPGQSCSIETDQWDQHPWLLGQTTKWLRGHAQWDRTPERWMPLAYKLMAYNAWLAPETWTYEVNQETQPDTVIAEFGRLANEFLAAQPDMNRPYILPDGKGVLWLSESDPMRGILFPFKRMSFPDGVTGHGVLETTIGEVTSTHRFQTKVIRGDNLLTGFDIEAPSLPDTRVVAESLHRPSASTGKSPTHPKTYEFSQVPGEVKTTPWNEGSKIWKPTSSGKSLAWPDDGQARAFFPAGTRTLLPVGKRVKALGIQTVTPGVSFLIDTVDESGPGSMLELHGPLLGPAAIYFKGSLKENGWPQTALRQSVGLQFRGGGVYDLEADLLPWPDNRNRHSQVIGLDDPGTTVHFRGSWDAKGELCRPGLVLGDDTRFVIWPEAELSFIKNYGGFTLQLWVTGTGNNGGILELHPEFVADQSRYKVSTTRPRSVDIVPEGIGSIRMAGATLLTHHSRNLPMTARATGDEADTLQNNGHIIFEDRGTNRWLVRTRNQVYRGAVWIDHDLEIVTEKNLTLEGVTEPADVKFYYTAANAFQTRDIRKSPDRITIRKRGPAALILRGEQAYVDGSTLAIEEGTVEMHTNPALGGTFPDGVPLDAPYLQVKIGETGTYSVHADQIELRSLSMAGGSKLVWNPGSRIEAIDPVRLAGTLQFMGEPAPDPIILLEAPRIDIAEETLPEGWQIREADGSMQLIILAEQN